MLCERGMYRSAKTLVEAMERSGFVLTRRLQAMMLVVTCKQGQVDAAESWFHSSRRGAALLRVALRCAALRCVALRCAVVAGGVTVAPVSRMRAESGPALALLECFAERRFGLQALALLGHVNTVDDGVTAQHLRVTMLAAAGAGSLPVVMAIFDAVRRGVVVRRSLPHRAVLTPRLLSCGACSWRRRP
jgi:hypothetical protein